MTKILLGFIILTSRQVTGTLLKQTATTSIQVL